MPISVMLKRRMVTLDVAPDGPFLWAIREAAGLAGTKYGGGIALCGACTVHVNGQAGLRVKDEVSPFIIPIAVPWRMWRMWRR
jgi:aerobic-type carbon monoxide dehydrogenase small subunit (CoxS/CutS family)